MFELPTRLSKNFYTKEFINASSDLITDKHLENLLIYYIPILQGVRDFYSRRFPDHPVSIKITSFIRSKSRNLDAGGRDNSAHVNPKVGAIDAVIYIPERNNLDRKELFDLIIGINPGIRVGVYDSVTNPNRPDFHIDAGSILGLYPVWQELVQ